MIKKYRVTFADALYHIRTMDLDAQSWSDAVEQFTSAYPDYTGFKIEEVKK